MNPQMPEPITSEELQSSSTVVPKQHRKWDGVGEIHWALLILGYGLLRWLRSNSQSGSIWNHSFTGFVYLFLLLMIVPMVIENLRKRVPSLQRRGVEARRVNSLKKTIVTILAAYGVVCVLAILRIPFSVRGGVMGLMIAAFYAWHFARIVRWKLLTAAVLALGMVMIAALPGLPPVSEQQRFPLMFLFYGLTTLISGGITLWQFLHDPQPPAQEVQ